MTDREFRYELWATTRPDDTYYVTNWDRKQKITVVASTKQEAINAAAAALGEAGSRRHWVFSTISLTDARLPEGNHHA